MHSLASDVVFAWRRLRKSRVTSAAAVLSLALAIGACTSAFRLIDALLLRPLPIQDPARLFVLSRDGVDSWEYPLFRNLRTALEDHADLFAVSYAERVDLTYGTYQEMEKAVVQYVSGSLFA